MHHSCFVSVIHATITIILLLSRVRGLHIKVLATKRLVYYARHYLLQLVHEQKSSFRIKICEVDHASHKFCKN